MATVHTMTCRELVGLVTDYLDDALTLGERHRVERHLGRCPACTRYVRQLLATIHLVGRLREDNVPGAARSDVLVAFRAWKSA